MYINNKKGENNMKKTLIRDLRNKAQTKEIIAGTVVDVTFPEEHRGLIVRYTDSNGVSIASYGRNIGITVDIKVPSLKTMERWDSDGFCKSVGGEKVEPDGWDSNGMPSWLLVMGMI